MDEESKKTLVDSVEDDLFSLYCDLYQTAREWLASSAALELDEVIDTICILDRFEDMLDLEALQKAAPPISRKQRAEAILSRIRDALHQHFSSPHLDDGAIRALQEELREREAELHRLLGKLQGAVEHIPGIQERLAAREKIQSLVQMTKRVKDFANTLSDIGDLEWESNYSTLRLQIAPKEGRAYHPFSSKFFTCRIEQDTSIAAAVHRDHLLLTIDGAFIFIFLGIRSVPALQARTITIHRWEGLRVEGPQTTLTVRREHDAPRVRVE